MKFELQFFTPGARLQLVLDKNGHLTTNFKNAKKFPSITKANEALTDYIQKHGLNGHVTYEENGQFYSIKG